MAVKGRRRSWQTKVIILARAESRSGMGKGVCMLRKDLICLNCPLHIVCFSINAPPMGSEPKAECAPSGIGMHTLIDPEIRETVPGRFP
jgi:hypothetical protein